MMGALTFFFKLLPYIWPFLREMVLGRKSFLEAVRDNKKKAFFISTVVFSFGLNFFIVPRTTSLAFQHLALEKKYKELEQKYNSRLSSQKHPVIQGQETQLTIKKPDPSIDEAVEEVIEIPQAVDVGVVSPPIKKPHKHPKPATLPKNLVNLKADYERMRLREERENN